MERNYTKKFIRFLKENGVFAAFTREFYNIDQIEKRNKWTEEFTQIFDKKPSVSLIDYCEKIKYEEDFIQYAFLWSKTKQGDEFWRKLSFEWHTYCD